MVALPYATFFGFIGTPVDRTVYGKGHLQDLRLQGRSGLTFAIFSEEDDLNKVTATVDALFTLLQRSHKA